MRLNDIMKEPLVYIIDRNKAYREVVQNCLEAVQFNNIKHYDNGESCYSRLDIQADIIILDYFLGDDTWNGIDFMTEYKRVSPKTNFIFMSSDSDLKKAVEAIKKGASDYILKSKRTIPQLAKRAEITKKIFSTKRI